MVVVNDGGASVSAVVEPFRDAFAISLQEFPERRGRSDAANLGVEAATEDLVALVVFVSVAALIAGLVGVIARRTGEAERARAESEALARTTGALVGEQEPLPTLLAQLRSTFALDAAAIRQPAMVSGASAAVLRCMPHLL